MRYFSFLSFLFCFLSVYAQSINQIKADKDNYIYGEGFGATERAADDAALNDLIRKISLTIKSDFTSKEREATIGKQFSSESSYESVIKTYSSATLNNTERLIIKHEPDAEVFRYIKRSEIDRIFKARADKALEFVRLADVALAKTQIDDALRYYYWSLCLVRSLRYPNEVKISVDGKEQLLVAFLLAKIDEVCSDVSIAVEKESDDTYSLYAKYKGNPVRSMDYTYNDGSGYGAVYSARDGEGVIEVNPSMISSQIQLKLEYEFQGMAVTDREVEGVISSYSDVFKHAYIPVPLKNKNASSNVRPETVVKPAIAKSEKTDNGLILTDPDLLDKHNDMMMDIVEAVSRKSLNDVKNLFSEDGFSELSNILQYGKYSVSKNQELQYYSDDSNGNIVCRGMQCMFYFSGKRNFNEQLSFFFKNGKVEHVALGLGKQMAEEEIFEHNTWGVESRRRIVSFLEDYRTAYAMKNIQYMEDVFDDNAVIIVGNMKMKRDPMLNDRNLTAHQVVTTTRYTKREFLQHLRATFRSKEYVNLHFSDCEIIKLGREERYGIQVKQDYFSSNYGDTGYLYLLVDLTNPNLPVIHVRTWQEAPDPEFGIIGPGNF